MRKHSIQILCLALLGLGACSEAKEQLGLEKEAPDEFAVIKRAPLDLPPNYNLRPPRPGAPRPQEQATNKQAKEALFGNSPGSQIHGTPSSAESVLLFQAGGNRADPAIRQKIDSETQELRDRNKPVAQKLFGIGGDPDAVSASIVDAPEEAERIRQNIEDGKAVTEGNTPSIEE